MFIPLKLILIGFDPSPYFSPGGWFWTCSNLNNMLGMLVVAWCDLSEHRHVRGKSPLISTPNWMIWIFGNLRYFFPIKDLQTKSEKGCVSHLWPVAGRRARRALQEWRFQLSGAGPDFFRFGTQTQLIEGNWISLPGLVNIHKMVIHYSCELEKWWFSWISLPSGKHTKNDGKIHHAI